MSSKKLHKLVLSTVPKGANILYVGCEDGAILHELGPAYGLGIDNKRNVTKAQEKYPELHFSYGSILSIPQDKKFDFIILDDILPYIEDVYSVLKFLRSLCNDNAKLVTTKIPSVLTIHKVFNVMASPYVREDNKQKNWVPNQLFFTLLYLSGFLPRPERRSCIIADVLENKKRKKYSYSIIIPAFNEEGNIAECINKIPPLRREYEVIVVNDGSKDRTGAIVKEIMKKDKRVRLIDYEKNRGKGYATKQGMDAAKNDVLMILDADMTVEPRDLLLFIEPFELQSAEFVNGTRMVYPMEDQAMRRLNLFGNKIFSIIFSYILGQHVTDTLCGTKCLFRKDYQRIKLEDDAWPDFDILFGASKLNLKIIEIPVHYQRRVSGESKMLPLKHGFMLLRESWKGFIELKIKYNY